MSEQMHVGAFMPVLNEEEGIHDSILALDDQTYDIDRLLIIDGDSDDNTLEEIERAREKVPYEVDVEIVHGSVRRASEHGARNIAHWLVEEFGDGVVLRCEGDSSLADNFTEKAVEALSDPANTVFGAPVRPHRPDVKRPKKRFFTMLQNADRLPKGRGMAFRAKDFLEVGGYQLEYDEDITDSSIGCLEDGIITSKLRDRGKVVFCEQTHVRSTIPSTTATSLSRWKTAIKLEATFGPTKYFTRIGNPLHFAAARMRDEIPIDRDLLREQDDTSYLSQISSMADPTARNTRSGADGYLRRISSMADPTARNTRSGADGYLRRISSPLYFAARKVKRQIRS